MKKYLALAMFLVLAVVLVSPFSVSAKTKAGVKSGSFFYFFDKTFERANLFFTFSLEKKAKKALENAEERLAEAEESASENKQEAVAEAMENYQKNIEVLEKVLAKVPEEAKEAITKAIEADKERQEEMTKKIEEINNEIKKEDNDFKKDEEEKANDDVGDNESGKEEVENENKDENKKDEQSKEIEKLKQNKEVQPKKADQSSEIEKLQKEIQDLKQKVEKQSNTNSSLYLSPVNTIPSNITVCNGKNWTTCPLGQKFYCPDTGDAQCLNENIGSNSVTEDPALKIEKCKAERDSVRNKMLEESRQLVEEGLRKFQDQLLQQFYNSISPGTVTASEIMTTLVAPQIKAKREKDMQTMTAGVDVYLNNEYIKCLN